MRAQRSRKNRLALTPHWCEKEFFGVKLGDRRLEKRFIKIAHNLSKRSESCIHQAFDTWSEEKAAYRFFENERIKHEDLLRPHQLKTVERIAEFSKNVVLLVQDTSYLSYTNHPKTTGLGPIWQLSRGKNAAKGLVLHTMLALNPEGVPLGIINQQIWARQRNVRTWKEFSERRIMNKGIFFKNKESHCWVRAMKDASDLLPRTTKSIVIGDRESDIYEFMLSAEKMKTNYVIRAGKDRRLIPKTIKFSLEKRLKTQKLRSTHGPRPKLWSYLKSSPVQGSFDIEVPKTFQGQALKVTNRKAKLSVRWAEVQFLPPRRNVALDRKRIRNSLVPKVYAVYIRESHPPKGIEGLEWMLLTNVPVTGFTSAKEIIGWYKKRWQIEVFHKILKSGCNVESSRLQTGNRLKRYVTLCSVIAWRLHYLTYIGREYPDISADKILSSQEWKTLSWLVHRKSSQLKKPPSIGEAILWIARLGGFLGRKSDGRPGVTSVWRGWRRLHQMIEDANIFKSLPQTYG